MKQGEGNFSIYTNYNSGILHLIKYSDAEMDVIKSNGNRNDFLLSAKYTIDDGILYISGILTKTKDISGEYGMYDFVCKPEVVNETIKNVYISPDRIISKKYWYSPNKKLVVIKRGNYLERTGVLKTYKTSIFKITE